MLFPLIKSLKGVISLSRLHDNNHIFLVAGIWQASVFCVIFKNRNQNKLGSSFASFIVITKKLEFVGVQYSCWPVAAHYCWLVDVYSCTVGLLTRCCSVVLLTRCCSVVLLTCCCSVLLLTRYALGAIRCCSYTVFRVILFCLTQNPPMSWFISLIREIQNNWGSVISNKHNRIWTVWNTHDELGGSVQPTL